jgi:uncharacterized membrane protein YphA (DoxX/SURF4 family)
MSGSSFTDPGWAAKQADTIVRVVDLVRARTTRPIVVMARGLVFGIIAVVGGLTALLLGLIAFTRGLQAAIEWPFSHATAVWVSYLVVGGLLVLIGSVLMRKRHAAAAS